MIVVARERARSFVSDGSYGTRGPRGPQRGPSAAREGGQDHHGAHGPLVTGIPAPDGPLVTGRVEWRDESVDALRRKLGADSDGTLICPLPGHSGRAFIDASPDGNDSDPGEPRLLCCGGRWRSLGEVRAAIGYGHDRLRTNIEIATWTRRLGFEVGAFTPLQVQPPSLHGEAPDIALRARDGFALLIGLRWADGPHRPVAWSVRFTAAWCELTLREARRANIQLVEAHVIVEVGRVGRTPLFLPGRHRPLHIIHDAGHEPPQTAPPDPNTGGLEDRDSLVALLVSAFDAVEVPRQPRLGPTDVGADPCGYPGHRGEEWRLATGGSTVCGRCHPPAKGLHVVPVVDEAA
jgi:hypothetical protein